MRLFHAFISGTNKSIGLLAVTDEMAAIIKSSDGLATRLQDRLKLRLEAVELIDDEETLMATCNKLREAFVQF